MWKSRIILLICLTFSSCWVGVNAKEKIYIHGISVYPPYWYSKKNNETGDPGPAKHVIQRVYDNADLKIKWIEVPYARSLQYLQNGTIHFANVAEVPGLDSLVSFPTPSIQINIRTYAKKGEKNIPITVENMVGEKVGVIRSWPLMSVQSLLNKDSGVHVSIIGTPLQAVQMLLNNRIKYLVILEDPILALDKKLTVNLDSSSVLSIRGWYTSVVKAAPDSENLHKLVEKSFNELVARGEILISDIGALTLATP